jgi:acetate kinase
MTAAPVILCLNSGSSSLKFALYRVGMGADMALLSGAVERIGLPNGRLSVHSQTLGLSREELGAFHDHQAAVQAAFDIMEQLQLPTPEAVGHRIVHGGAGHIAPKQVDARLREDLQRLVPFAPLHLPAEVQGIEAVTARFP